MVTTNKKLPKYRPSTSLDWSILGERTKDIYSFIFPPLTYRKTFDEWKKEKQQLVELLIWLENNLINYSTLAKSTPKTIHVLTRISVSMLNNIDTGNWALENDMWKSLLDRIQSSKLEADEQFRRISGLPF